MANILYLHGMYNEKVKNQYLDTFTTSVKNKTRSTNERIFKISCPIEEDYGKDLYAFNLDEIKKLLFELRPRKPVQSRSYGSLLSNYINWAIDEGYRDNDLNPLDGLDIDWYKQFCDDKLNIYYTEEQLNNITNKLVNAQDQVLLQLLFEGVGGEGFEEIFNLRRSDVDFESRVLTLHDKYENVRTMNVSDRCINFIEKALRQDEYIKDNGKYVVVKSRETITLEDSGYVIKKARNKRGKDDKANYFMLSQRIQTINKQLNEQITFLAIRNSGMLKYAYIVIKQEGELLNDHIELICERFNTGKTMINGEERYNVYQFKRSFLNEETVKKVYVEESV